ncbi:hypothetical protein [Vogesella sp. LIG4]|uniref:hypothetical protein n=1 Tax=Vogesella sp. LIG4 TaxID=1192162 RepID=UPI00081FB241|nr:hypothetical protein [Vogesella sp. LIG4]SCK12150.1 hypothetical protein PSELUDRAFT_1074 [Vogesella sp. LIG4]
MPALDDFLPHYQFSERHQRRVSTDAGQLRAALAALPQWRDPLVERLIALREAPARLAASLGARRQLPAQPFGLHSFTMLHQDDGGLVYGLAGCFWQADYGLRTLADAAGFARCSDVPRLVLGWQIKPLPDGGSLLQTETRVHCPDRASYLRFLPYWCLIRPVSGLIRRRMLGIVARIAQQQVAG